MIIDKRYKVTQELVNQMRLLREQGRTLQSIADEFEVSYSTVLYWTNQEQRDKQRAKNALRKRTGKELELSIQKDLIRRKEMFKNNKNVFLRHRIQSAIGEKRCNRKTVEGMDIDTAKKLLKSGILNTPNAKIQ